MRVWVIWYEERDEPWESHVVGDHVYASESLAIEAAKKLLPRASEIDYESWSPCGWAIREYGVEGVEISSDESPDEDYLHWAKIVEDAEPERADGFRIVPEAYVQAVDELVCASIAMSGWRVVPPKDRDQLQELVVECVNAADAVIEARGEGE